MDPPDLGALEHRRPDVARSARDDRALTDAGLLSPRRDGWYVLYELERERLTELGSDLLGYVG
jgi:hypothetical protein